MENLSEVQIVDTKSSNFIRPYSVKFVQNGKARVWDCIKVHNSVLIVIYNISRKVLVLVKQFRPDALQLPELRMTSSGRANNLAKEEQTADSPRSRSNSAPGSNRQSIQS
ncbi:hypothetical protein WDU94_005418 [Cyamophila willieti]